jgi:hypothetical protein
MGAFYRKPEPSGRRWRDQAMTSRRSSARSFLAAISRTPPHAGGGAVPRTGARTGELRQDWQGAFVVTHIGRAGR